MRKCIRQSKGSMNRRSFLDGQPDGSKESEFPFAAAMNTTNFDAFIKENEHKGTEYVKQLHDKRGMNLLHCACINDSAELIEPLISKYHINVNEVDVDGYSPLFYCVNQWSDECVEKLLLYHPRLDIVTKDCVIHATGCVYPYSFVHANV